MIRASFDVSLVMPFYLLTYLSWGMFDKLAPFGLSLLLSIYFPLLFLMEISRISEVLSLPAPPLEVVVSLVLLSMIPTGLLFLRMIGFWGSAI